MKKKIINFRSTHAFFLLCLGFLTYTTPLTAQTWTKQGGDIDGEAGLDESGYSVSLSSDGTTVAIGARYNGNGSNRGHVRVYKLISGTWTQQGADIDGEANNDASGFSVSLSSDGTTVAIGAPSNDGTNSNAGQVRVYKLISGTWTKQGADIDGEAGNDQSGWSVSLSSDGTTVAIGARNNDGTGSNAGQVRVYQLISGTWTQQGADIDGEAASDNSGWSVSLSSDGTTVAIGAHLNDGTGADAGHVRVYQLISGTWTQQGADIDGEAAGDNSGYSVSLSADGTTVAIGARFNDGTGSDAGHVRVYKLISGTWTKQGADIDGETTNDQSGWSVSLSQDGTTVAIGAILNDGSATSAGHVRVYKLISGTWTKQGADIDGEANSDQSGFSVSLSQDGTTVAIGANLNDGNGVNSGQVRVYQLTAVMPIELLAFTGTAHPTGNLLEWQTATEQNAHNFTLERSADGQKFTPLSITKVKGSNSDYTYLDENPLAGLNYYRLKINDLDGKMEYSKTISIQSKGKSKVKIYPSVTAGNLTVENAARFDIMNMAGQVVLTQSAPIYNSSFNIHHFPNGIYVVTGIDTEGGVFSQKIIKQ